MDNDSKILSEEDKEGKNTVKKNVGTREVERVKF